LPAARAACYGAVVQSTTLVAKTTRVYGAVQSPGHVTVEGLVEGEIEAGGTVTVAAGGTVVAEVRARAAVLAGEVIGNVTCSESIQVAAGARVVGDLRAPDVGIDAEAVVDGRIDLLPPEARSMPVQRAPATLRGVAARRPTAPRTPAVAPMPTPTPAPPSDDDHEQQWQADATVEQSSPLVARAVPTFPRPLGRVRLRQRGPTEGGA
jgi:cytoskeletal protein CcmA (bactofilin family)